MGATWLVTGEPATFSMSGQCAGYWSAEGHDDIAWSYENPLEEARELAGLVAFDDDKVRTATCGNPASVGT